MRPRRPRVPAVRRHTSSGIPREQLGDAVGGPVAGDGDVGQHAARRLTRALVRAQRASAKSFAGSTLDRHAGTPV